MGVENLAKIYILLHVRKFNKKSECLHCHESEKLIGVFYSKKKALDIIEFYKKLEGFKDYPNGFCLQEYLIDEIDDLKIDRLLENLKKGMYVG